MDFEEMDHEDFREFVESNEEELLEVVSGFYSDVKSGIGEELEEIESGIGASVLPPNLCVFAPIEKVNDDLSEGNYRIEDISEEEFLLAMSVYLAYKHKEVMPDEISEVCFYFMNYQQDHWISKIIEYVSNKGYQGYAGRFFPEYDSLAVNSFISEGYLSDDAPELLKPLSLFMLLIGNDSGDTIVHEMTHAYISTQSKFRTYDRDIFSIDEGAAQAVSNVMDGGNIPSTDYYERRDAKQEVMQAARQVFMESVEGMETGEAVSTIRTEAVDAIDKVVDGEDPIKALREEGGYRSKMVRIVSYATKRMADDVMKDLAIVGLRKNGAFQEYLEEGNQIDKLKEIDRIQGDLEKLRQDGRMLVAKADSSSMKQGLREDTEKVGRQAQKIFEVVTEKFEDSLEEENSISVLEDVFGDPDWTDPGRYPDEISMEDYLEGVLYRYSNVVEEGLERAEKMEKAAEIIHEEGEELVDRYDNQEVQELVQGIIRETERLHSEIDGVRQSLEQADQMANLAEEKIQRLSE